jgi:hypothetical protein
VNKDGSVIEKFLIGGEEVHLLFEPGSVKVWAKDFSKTPILSSSN